MLAPRLIRSEPARPGASFQERGFSFIPIRPAHLNFLRFVYGRDVPTVDEVVGRTMVDDRYLPLGVCIVHFEPCGTNTVHAHFGKWLRIYPKDILRGMSQVTNWLRQHDIFILHAIADEAVDGSDTLLKWLSGEPTGYRNEIGPIYRIDLHNCKI